MGYFIVTILLACSLAACNNPASSSHEMDSQSLTAVVRQSNHDIVNEAPQKSAPTIGFKYLDLNLCEDKRDPKEIPTEIDTMEDTCPPVGPYQIIRHGIDARDGIKVIYQDHTIDFYDRITGDLAPAGFPGLRKNGKLEWRFSGDEDSSKYFALIFRVDSTDQTTAEYGRVSQLFVTALRGKDTCLVGVTKTNEEARELADRLLDQALPCL